MRKLSLLLLFLCSLSIPISAQSPSNTVRCLVKGILQDSLTLSGEEYATGRVYKKVDPDKMNKTFVTNKDGKFDFTITEAGDYLVRISSLGKRDLEKEFSVSGTDQSIDLGTLHIAESDQRLQEVVVTALKPLVRMEVDRMEYDVEQDPDSKTDQLIEMLRKVPLVSVDSEDNIEVNGSEKFKIHINGKPNNMMTNNPKEVLRSMPASTVKRIEVITNPGAKYDAEGVTGILNIITTGSSLQGYTATANAGVSNSNVNTGIYGTYQKGKFTTSLRYNYGNYDPPSGTGHTEYISFHSDEYHRMNIDGSYTYKGNNQNGGLEASYEFDTLRLLSVSGDFYWGDGKVNQWASEEMKNRQNQRTYFYNSKKRNTYDYYWIGGSVDYQRSFKRNKEELFTFSYRLGASSQTSDNWREYSNLETYVPVEETPLINMTNVQSDNSQHSTEHSFQADYTKPFAKKHQIETGLKYILRLNDSEGNYFSAPLGSSDFQPDESQNSTYNYNQDIGAAYFSYRFAWKSLTARAGARYEHTFQKVNYHQAERENLRVEYDDVVPSVLLGYKLSDATNLRFSYDMRISRPGIWYLDPYVDEQTPFYLQYGNPDLSTEKSHTFNLSYSYSSQKVFLNLAGYYSFVNNSIEKYTFVQNDTVHSTYDNIGERTNSGVNLYFKWTISPRTNIYTNSSLSYSDFKSTAMDVRNHGFTFNGNGGIQHTLPGDIRLSINGGGRTANVRLQGTRSGYYYYGVSVSREFLDKKLNVSLRARNFFSRYQTYTGTDETDDFRIYNTDRSYNMNYGINVSYRLGELSTGVKKAKRTIQNDDIKSGGNNSQGGE